MILPAELQALILRRACRRAPVPDTPTTLQCDIEALDPPGFCHARPDNVLLYDAKALCTVMRLSRQHYMLAAPLLYHSIVLTRPSQLLLLFRTLGERPALGRLVRHLFVGPASLSSEHAAVNLSSGYANYERAFSIAPEVERRDDARSCTPRGSILSHTQEVDLAETLALHAGADGSGVDIREPGWNNSDFLGTNEWILRLYDARAMLVWLRALAFEESQREFVRWHTSPYNVEALTYTLRAEAPHAAAQLSAWEGTLEDDDGDDPFAPRPLRLRRPGTRHDPLDWADAVDVLFALPASEDDVLVALVWRIVKQMPSSALPRWLLVVMAKALAGGQWHAMNKLREHAPMLHSAPAMKALSPATPYFVRDRFDDLCLFARSDAAPLVCMGRPQYPTPQGATPPPPLDMAVELQGGRVDATRPRPPFGVALEDLAVPGQPRGQSVRPAPVLGDLVAMVQSLLALTPQLTSLALGGVMERAIVGLRTPCALPELRHVLLGPPPPMSTAPFRFDAPALDAVERLSITGCMLSGNEARVLGGATQALPRLRHVVWSMHLGAAHDGGVGIVAAIAMILGITIPGVVPPPPDTAPRAGVEALDVYLTPTTEERVYATAPDYVLADTRLRLLPASTARPSHPILYEWAAEISAPYT